MAHDVFISHARSDKPIADAVCATLERAGIRCWIAPRDIQPGADWGSSIIQGLKGSRAFVLVLSGSANTSPHITREVERAVHQGIPVIPLRVEDVMPEGALEYHLGSLHWLDAMTPPLEAHLKRLADTLSAVLGNLSAPPVPLLAPPSPLSPPSPATPIEAPEPLKVGGERRSAATEIVPTWVWLTDRRRFGINPFIPLAFLLSGVIALMSPDSGEELRLLCCQGFESVDPLAWWLLTGMLFVIATHVSRSDLVALVVFVFLGAAFDALVGVWRQFDWNLPTALRSASLDAMIMISFPLAVRLGGPRLLTTAGVLASAFILFASTRAQNSPELLFWRGLLGAVLGGLVFLAIVLQLRRRGHRLESGRFLSVSPRAAVSASASGTEQS